MEEKWASLEHMGLSKYMISTYGHVLNITTGYKLTGFINQGYQMIGFRDINGKRINHSVHRLVAINFIPCDDMDIMTVDHIDRNRLNNNINNLRWATRSEQIINQNKTNRKSKKVYQYDINDKLLNIWESTITASKVLGIDESGIRKCCQGKYITSAGFKWQYDQDQTNKFEEWKPILLENFEEIYASTLGRIKFKSGNPTFGHISSDYMFVSLKDINGKKYSKSVHRLIAHAFHGNKDNLIVNHKNGNKLDNRPENLEYITQSENVKHSIDTGLSNLSKNYHSVVCIHPTNNTIIKNYISLKDASIELKIPHPNIIKVCKGERKTAGGYRWLYSDDPLMKNFNNKLNEIVFVPKITQLNIIK